MKRMVLLLALLFVLPLAGLAQAETEIPFPDEDYVSNYFGVELWIQMEQPLEYPADGWWPDALPEEILYNGSYAAGVINAHRSTNGVEPLIDPDSYFISPTYDEQIEDGWQYTIEFIGLRPSEVQLLFDTLGGTEKYLPGASFVYMPLLRRGFSIWTDDPAKPLELNINGTIFAVEYGEAMADIRERATELFTELYGQEPMLDITMSQYSYTDGSGGADLAIYAELPAG